MIFDDTTNSDYYVSPGPDHGGSFVEADESDREPCCEFCRTTDRVRPVPGAPEVISCIRCEVQTYAEYEPRLVAMMGEVVARASVARLCPDCGRLTNCPTHERQCPAGLSWKAVRS